MMRQVLYSCHCAIACLSTFCWWILRVIKACRVTLWYILFTVGLCWTAVFYSTYSLSEKCPSGQSQMVNCMTELRMLNRLLAEVLLQYILQRHVPAVKAHMKYSWDRIPSEALGCNWRLWMMLNPFNASCSKLFLFKGFSTILV